jgi:hypothetical protein
VTESRSRRKPEPHEYDADGWVVIPPFKRVGRPPKENLRLVVTNFLREKGLSMTEIARNKAGFGSTLKRTADAAGRTYERETVTTSSFDTNAKQVERVVWYESDRDLFEYVFNRSFGHLLS